MIARRLRVMLTVSSLVVPVALAWVTPAHAQGGAAFGGGGSANAANNGVSNLLLPAAALAYGAYWLALGMHHHWLTVPHRVGHPYAITPKPRTSEAAGYEGEPEEKGESGDKEAP